MLAFNQGSSVPFQSLTLTANTAVDSLRLLIKGGEIRSSRAVKFKGIFAHQDPDFDVWEFLITIEAVSMFLGDPSIPFDAVLLHGVQTSASFRHLYGAYPPDNPQGHEIVLQPLYIQKHFPRFSGDNSTVYDSLLSSQCVDHSRHTDCLLGAGQTRLEITAIGDPLPGGGLLLECEAE